MKISRKEYVPFPGSNCRRLSDLSNTFIQEFEKENPDLSLTQIGVITHLWIEGRIALVIDKRAYSQIMGNYYMS